MSEYFVSEACYRRDKLTDCGQVLIGWLTECGNFVWERGGATFREDRLSGVT